MPDIAAPRKGDWIQTAITKQKFYPLDARAEDVDIRDIAHALSNICRFCGHSSEFYSVAQHSVIAASIVPQEAKLAALLHDAAEAYMGDIARPWKRFLFIRRGDGGAYADLYANYDAIKDVEHSLLDVILAKFGCQPRANVAVWKAVKNADEVMLVTEARDLMAPLADNWRNTFSATDPRTPLSEPIVPWTTVVARANFLKAFFSLTESGNGRG